MLSRLSRSLPDVLSLTAEPDGRLSGIVSYGGAYGR